MKDNTKGVCMMLTCAALWSTAGILFKFIPWNGFVIAGARGLFAGLTVLAYMLLRRQPILITGRTIRTGVIMGLTCLLFVVANKLTTAANAIVLEYTAPVFLLVFSVLLRGKRFRGPDVAAVLLTLGGVSLFFFDQLSPGRLLGNLLGVCSGCCMGLMYLFVGDVTPAERLSSTLLAEFFTALVGLPFALFTPVELSFRPVALIVLLGVFQLGIPYILYVLSASYCSPLACCLMGSVEPILNPVWVALFYGERPGVFALCGGVLVILAITAWSVYDQRHAPAESGAACP